jgi:hypothetical protein
LIMFFRALFTIRSFCFNVDRIISSTVTENVLTQIVMLVKLILHNEGHPQDQQNKAAHTVLIQLIYLAIENNDTK